MKILAVETSSKVASICLFDEHQLIGEVTTNHRLTHSEQLLPMVDELLKSVQHQLSDVDLFAVAEGPGSFTGLRIGITTVKGFAYALNKPIVSVNTLEAMCYAVSPDRLQVCPMLDARNNQVFSGLFEPCGMEYVLCGEYMALPLLDLLGQIRKTNIKTAFVGDGSLVYQEIIKEELDEMAFFPHPQLALQRAAYVGTLALMQFQKGNVMDSFQVQPFYLRKSQAEQQYEKKCE